MSFSTILRYLGFIGIWTGLHSAVGSSSDSSQEPEVPGMIPSHPVLPHTFVSPSADSRRTVVSYWRKYVHKELVG